MLLCQDITLVSQPCTYQINSDSVDKLKSVNFMSLNRETSKIEFMVSSQLLYQRYNISQMDRI